MNKRPLIAGEQCAVTNLFFKNLFNHHHGKSNLLFFPSDDNLRLVHTWRGDINAGTRLLHQFSNQLIIGTSDEWVIHFFNVHSLHSTLVLR